MNPTHFDFCDINLVPRKCVVESRSECDTSIQIGNHRFKLPVVPANMECVINDDVALKLASAGYFYIYHRFSVDVVVFARKMIEKNLPVSISIGVNEDAYKICEKLIAKQLKIDFLTIDIAHGHSIKTEKMLKWIYENWKNDRPFLIVGNVSTPEAVIDLESWGADAIKVGIGPGSACTTYVATGFGSRNAQAYSVQLCAKAKKNPKTMIIADGGIKEPGDIAKALVMGADFVMIGGLFSALNDSPGSQVMGQDGRLYKEFWGSASQHAGSMHGGPTATKSNRIEGTKKLVLMKDHSILHEMTYLTECLQSAISYGGGNDLSTFKQVEYF